METREYRTIDKTAWGPGPWQNEPDKRQWRDEATGLPCLLVRAPRLGNLCGYVGVPPGHPLHGKHYDAPDVSVHGGLTFADACGHGEDESTGICHVPGAGEPDTVWWFGFDCAHSRDFSPASTMRRHELAKTDPVFADHAFDLEEVYRDVAYVVAECASLAAELAAIMPKTRRA